MIVKTKKNQKKKKINLYFSSKAMSNNINKISQTVKDKKKQEEFKKEMEPFIKLFDRYTKEQKSKTTIDWNKIHPPDPEQLIDYSSLKHAEQKVVHDLMSQLVVIKLNGKEKKKKKKF